jgi:hypothetical protein
MVTDWQVTAHHLNPVTTGLTRTASRQPPRTQGARHREGRTQHEPSTAREIT